VLGADSHEVEGLWKKMYQETLHQGRAGIVMRAISIIDTALWDLNARTAGVPLHSYLGAVRTDRVPAYASGGYYVEGKSAADLGAEMAQFAAQGFKAMKMKTGRLSPAEEEDRLRAAREAVGPDVELMMDANNAWSDLSEALQYVRRFEKYEPYFIEEPFLPDDIDNHARLARHTRVLVATGEIEAGRWRHKELLDKGAAAILQSDAAVCGGISEWRRISGLAAGYGVPIYPHWFHDLHAPLVASTANARCVEFFLDDEVLNFRRLLDRQMTYVDGSLLLHQEPGLGFGFDEAAVAAFGLDRGAGKAWTHLRA
jgi:L-alanine-DL-glutamate epimerase-like enolase superfamily enzyme